MKVETSVTNKRARFDSEDPFLPDLCFLSASDSPKYSVSPTTTFGFPDRILSTSLNNQSSTSSDLKADENCGSDEISKSIRNSFRSVEKRNEIIKSPAKKKRKVSPVSSADKMPSTDEIEEFFAVAEKSEKKRFLEKYNYDIVKDVALEGRYQWVCLKP